MDLNMVEQLMSDTAEGIAYQEVRRPPASVVPDRTLTVVTDPPTGSLGPPLLQNLGSRRRGRPLRAGGPPSRASAGAPRFSLPPSSVLLTDPFLATRPRRTSSPPFPSPLFPNVNRPWKSPPKQRTRSQNPSDKQKGGRLFSLEDEFEKKKKVISYGITLSLENLVVTSFRSFRSLSFSSGRARED